MESMGRKEEKNSPEKTKELPEGSAGEKKKGSGRRKKPIKRSSVTGIRFTHDEYTTVQNRAKEANRKLTVYIREAALTGGKLKPFVSHEQTVLIRQLAGMANNLNQLTRKSHQAGMHMAMIYFRDLGKLIESVIEKIEKGDNTKGKD